MRSPRARPGPRRWSTPRSRRRANPGAGPGRRTAHRQPTTEQPRLAVRIGTSGWSYDHWEPELYPAGLPARDRLARYAAAFGTAELEQQLLPLAAAVDVRQLAAATARWIPLVGQGATGPDPRTELYAPEEWMHRIEAGWHELGDKRAVLLVQLAPTHERDDARLSYFLRLIPGWMRVAVGSATPAGTARRSSRYWNDMAWPTAS